MLARASDALLSSLPTRDPALLTAAGVCLLFALAGLLAGGALLPFALLCAVLAAAALSGDPRVERAWPLAYGALGYGAHTEILQAWPDRYVDRIFLHADSQLFGLVGLEPLGWTLGGPLEELANLFYASFYFAIPLGLAWAWRRGQADRYSRALTWAYSLCAVGWLLLPAGGYHSTGTPLTAAPGPATELVRWLYAQHPHFAAAFPSSHVAVSVALAGAVLGRRPGWWLWPLGVAFATVYGQYHFLVDAFAGWGVGLAALRLAEQPLAARAGELEPSAVRARTGAVGARSVSPARPAPRRPSS